MIVLYVDDSLTTRTFLAAVLAEIRDVTAVEAALGENALQLAQTDSPDLIISDLFLPDMGGEALLLKLRADERTRDIPVVILSGDELRRRRAALLAAGAVEYLIKPIAAEELASLVERYRP